MAIDDVIPATEIIEVETSNVGRANVSAFYAEPSPIEDEPTILNYASWGDFSKFGEPGSNCAAAFDAMLADADANNVPAKVTPGRYIYDSPSAMTVGAGSALRGENTGFPGHPENGRTIGATIIRPYSDNRMVPVVAMRAASALSGITFYYPDHVARLLSGENELDASQYGNTDGNPFFSGSPDVYAPSVVADFAHAADGSLAPTKNAGLRFQDLNFIGAYDAIYIGDALPAEETWAHAYNSGNPASYSSGNQLGTGDAIATNICGCVINRGIVLERNSIISLFRDCNLSAAYWVEASQLDLGGGNIQPLVRWAEEHGYAMFIRHRAVGVRLLDSTFRQMRAVAKVTAGMGDGPGGVDNGKLNGSTFTGIGVENVTTMFEVDPSSFLTGNRIQAGGLWHIKDNPSCTRAVFEIAADGAVAGAYNKVPLWIQMNSRNYYNNRIEISSSSTAGPILHTTAADAHVDYLFDGGRLGGVCIGDPTRAAFEVKGNPSLLVHRNAEFVAYAHGTSTVYDVSSTAEDGTVTQVTDPASVQLSLYGNVYKGIDQAQAVKGAPDYDGFTGCVFVPGDWDLDDDDEADTTDDPANSDTDSSSDDDDQ